MNEGDRVSLRQLPDGILQEAELCSVHGRVLELTARDSRELNTLEQKPAALTSECEPGAAAEITTPESIYLGVVERRQGQRLWINVEHYLDRKILAGIQATWKE